MRILAVDTSSSVASCAIVDGEKLISERILNNKLTHSQTIMPMIASALAESELKAEDIDVFAAVNGPGSFTGLRIGVSAVKALAHAVNKPCAAISTLEAMTYNIMFTEYLIAPIMDARRGEVYNAIYRFEDNKLVTVIEPRAVSVDECCEDILKIGKKTVFLGDGLPVYKNGIVKKLGGMAIAAPAHLNAQMAGSAAVLAKEKELIHYQVLAPVYLRKSQAEREYEKRMKGNE